MLTRREYFETTIEETLAFCSTCSTSWEIDVPVNGGRAMKDAGFEIVDGAWTGICESCQEKQVDASNNEYEALVRAAAELHRLHHVGHLAVVEIPAGEGFELEGSKLFGFWVMAKDTTEAGRDTFRQTVRSIVGNLNGNRGTNLLDNVAADGRQAIVHGIVD